MLLSLPSLLSMKSCKSHPCLDQERCGLRCHTSLLENAICFKLGHAAHVLTVPPDDFFTGRSISQTSSDTGYRIAGVVDLCTPSNMPVVLTLYSADSYARPAHLSVYSLSG